MGSPAEFHSPSVYEGGSGNGYTHSRPHTTQTKATFSGMTALGSIVALIISIISTAVPHWGNYRPHSFQNSAQVSHFGGGFSDPHSEGNFGPFQICYGYIITHCAGGRPGGFQTWPWIKVAGACSLLTVFSLAGLAFFSILHVAMQLQRRHICLSFQRAIFLKVVFAAIAGLGSLLACIFGGIEFHVNGRYGKFALSIGICYYLQIILIFVNILFIAVCYISYKKARKSPPPMVPRSRGHPTSNNVQYDDRNANGVAMTVNSQHPYGNRYGQPIQPIRPQGTTYLPYNNNAPQLPPTTNGGLGYNLHDTPLFQRPQPGPQQPPTYIQGHSNNGFMPVNLVVPPSSNTSPVQLSNSTATPVSAVAPIRSVPPLPLHIAQPLKPIQPVQPQMQPRVQVLPSPNNSGGHAVGVSFTPAGRGHASSNPGGGGHHGGSMESLNSTISSTLSFGSTASTGSGVSKELRSSLKKPKNKDTSSVSSRSSSKQVRISLGQEQTQV